jgi:hypothetical protein
MGHKTKVMEMGMIFSKNNSKILKLMQHEEVTTVGFTLRTKSDFTIDNGFFHQQNWV